MTDEQERFMRELAKVTIAVAERPSRLRGPWLFDEDELQKRAAQARQFLARVPS